MGFLNRYRQIPRDILKLIAAKYFLAIVNSAFMLILNIYLRKLGYDDPAIAKIVAYQYMGVLILAFPQGLFVRGRRLKPFYTLGATLFPVFSVLVLYFFRHGMHDAGVASLFFWSMSLLQLEAFTLPYIVRYGDKETESEAISLNYSTYAAGMITSGSIIGLLSWIGGLGHGASRLELDEYHILLFIAFLSIPALLMVWGVKEPMNEEIAARKIKSLGEYFSTYDWNIIIRAITPTTLIAIGAGLTIPFINLFFNGVFHIDSGTFGQIGMATAVLIFLSAILVPAVKRNFGYKIAITLSQCIAVTMLVLMALTELVSGYGWAVYFAVVFYMLRTPLMNMAGPMTSELVMNYVGKRNQDLTSALIAAIWSGSWFVSAKIFQWFRTTEMAYYQIFLITAGLYVIGIILYFLLIRDYSRSLKEREKQV